MVNVEEAGGFLAALSASLKQLENRQNNREQRNPCENRQSIQTGNRSSFPFDPFNAKEAEQFLKDEWQKIENEAKEYLQKERGNPEKSENPEYMIIGSDKSSDEDHPSFTNK